MTGDPVDDKPPASTDALESRVEVLEAKLAEVEAMLTLALRLLSVQRPVSALLEQYGATESQDLAVHALLDAVATRAATGGMYAPSFPGFVTELHERFPAVRGDREFVSLLLDALRLDRPAYRTLHAYVVARHWPQWT